MLFIKIPPLGPYSWNILVPRVAPSNKILWKFLEMWAFPLKMKEKIPVNKKVIQKASQPLKEVLRFKIVRSTNEDF